MLYVLKDVKRWLGELRGKDLAEAFAWSYKSVKLEFLLDYAETCLLGEKKASIIAEEIPLEVQVEEGNEQKQLSLMEEPQIQRFPDFQTNVHEELSSEIVSSDRSTMLTDENECSKVEEDKLVGTGKQNPDTSFSTPSSSSSISSSHSSIKEIKSYSAGVSGVFRNLITCGALDTDDTVLVTMDRDNKNVSKNYNDKADSNAAKIRKDDKLGGSARIFKSFWNPQSQQQQQYPSRKSIDGKSTNKNRKKLLEFLNQTTHKPFGGSIYSK
ncbi:protein UPSTREAM OF FLC [Senna tora]|uniref:Protein UPSTREAM OF FLC n=1 Tax=Senna tora TaxID=362788 RepID=A0A835C9U3_9FABA|nr:protein UPSTREAM OF FLC [Senna tora]